MPVWTYYIISIVLHEGFHFLASRCLFREGIRIGFSPAGFYASWKSFQPEKNKQCIICAAGPIGNLLAALIFSILPLDAGCKKEFIKANLFIGVFNLIPLYPMDGGNLLLIILYRLIGSNRTFEIMKKIGRGVRVFFIVTGIYILFSYKNPSLVLTVTLLPGVQSIKRSVNRLNLNAFIRRKERIIKRRAYPVRHILAMKELSLGEVMLLLDYDQFHIILVMDDTMQVILQLTEQQLIDAMINHDTGKTLEEIFIKKEIS